MERTLTALQAKAEEALSYFEQRARADKDKMYWTYREDRPAWVQQMVYKAHDNGGMLPDDYKFAFVVAALDRILESDDPAEAMDEIEADVYTSDLYAWLTSHLSRAGYVDDAVAEYGGEAGGIVDQIMLGQVAEKREVYWTVLNLLRQQTGEEGEPD